MNTLTSTLALAAALAGPADAFWRMRCPGRTGLARIDPIVNVGEESDHVHAISGGGSKFGPSPFYNSRSCTASRCLSRCDLIVEPSARLRPLFSPRAIFPASHAPDCFAADSPRGPVTFPIPCVFPSASL